MNDWELGLDLDKLQAFYAVAQLGSVSAAARALGRSQPAISHRLSALQESLGVTLLERVGRGVQPTAAGRTLADRCGELFALTRSIHAQALASDGAVRGTVTVGTYATVTSYLLTPPLARLLEAEPELSVRAVHALGMDLVKSLRAGRFDVALMAGDVPARGLEIVPVGRDRMVAVTAPGLAHECGGPTDVARLRYLAWGEGDDGAFLDVHELATSLGLVNERSLHVAHIESLRRLAALGAGFTIVPRYAVAEDLQAGHLVELEVPELDVTLDFVRVTRAGLVETPAIKAILDLIDALPLEPA